jgi:putative transposase
VSPGTADITTASFCGGLPLSEVWVTIRGMPPATSLPAAIEAPPARPARPAGVRLPARPASGLVCHQAYQFALDLTPRQQGAAASAVGASRFAFNWGLAHIKELLDRREAGEQVTIPWSLYALRRAWNQAKREAAPWWAENSKECYSSGLAGLASACHNYFASRDGKRAGQRVGFPRFRKRGHGREAVRFTTGAIRVEPDRHHVTLPRLGRLRTHESTRQSTRQLARRLEAGTARILAATLARSGGRWYVSFTCEVIRRVPSRPARRARQVGVDVGIRHLATLSTGERIPNPAPLKQAQTKLRRLNRQLARRHGPIAPDGARRVPSAGWTQTQASLRRVHPRVASIRRDALHKLTTGLGRGDDQIVVERLNVAGLTRRGTGKRGLNRALADAALAEVRRLLGYKCLWYGAALVEADRFSPSSKTCSGCGAVKTKLALHERTFRCDACGLVIDRDDNASINLQALLRLVAPPSAAGRRPSPGVARTRQSPVEAGEDPTLAWGTGRRSGKPAPAARLGETGTAGPQGPAARNATITHDRSRSR